MVMITDSCSAERMMISTDVTACIIRPKITNMKRHKTRSAFIFSINYIKRLSFIKTNIFLFIHGNNLAGQVEVKNESNIF